VGSEGAGTDPPGMHDAVSPAACFTWPGAAIRRFP